MRTTFASLLVVLSVAAPRALAGDVAYQLEVTALSDVNQPTMAAPSVIEWKDRVWAAPGVEESQEPLEPARTFDFLTARRFRIDGDGPEWLDGVAWPRTRELFHRNVHVFFARSFALGSVHGVPLYR